MATTKATSKKTTTGSSKTTSTPVATTTANNSELTTTVEGLVALTDQLTNDLAVLTSEVVSLRAAMANNSGNSNNTAETVDTSNFVSKGQITEVLRQMGVREHILSSARLK